MLTSVFLLSHEFPTEAARFRGPDGAGDRANIFPILCSGLVDGICQGLRYLHNNESINHLDLKPEDADMVPKITDFGLSRRFSGAQSRKITENIRGSL